MTVVKLTKPVDAYGDQIHEITFRPPTGKDIRKTGLPSMATTEDGITTTRTDMEAMAKLVVVLGNVPLSTFDAMALPDIMKCSETIMSFFTESGEIKTSSTDSMT
jgi:hypothetical protein